MKRKKPPNIQPDNGASGVRASMVKERHKTNIHRRRVRPLNAKTLETGCISYRGMSILMTWVNKITWIFTAPLCEMRYINVMTYFLEETTLELERFNKLGTNMCGFAKYFNIIAKTFSIFRAFGVELRCDITFRKGLLVYFLHIYKFYCRGRS